MRAVKDMIMRSRILTKAVRKIWASLWLALSALILSQAALAAETEPVDTGKALARLVSSHDKVMPGESFYIALETELDKHWHTYWLNPGDSGEPVQIRWNLPETLSAGEIVWPLPMPIATGPIINYGFEGTPVFPIPFTLSKDAVIGERINISANVYYLVCYDVCIPEQADLSLSLTVGETQEDTLSKAVIEAALSDAPAARSAKGGIVQTLSLIHI